MKQKRILIIADAAGFGGFYHVGDDAMTEVALRRLITIAGEKNLTLATPYPRTAAKTYGVKTVWLPMNTLKTCILLLLLKPIPTWFSSIKLLWHLFRAEIVFKAGGGNIVGKSSKFPILALARRWKKKIIFVSQTIGPLEPEYRRFLQKQLQDALWIGVRDRMFSQEQLGLPVHFAVDDAVFLKPEHNNLTTQIVSNNSNLVGISFSKLKPATEHQFQRLLQTTQEIMIDLKCTPVLIPHHAPHGRGDLKIINQIKLTWQETKMIIIEPVQPAQAVLALTGSLQLVLATRYHAVIFGLTMGVPAIGIYADPYSKAKMEGAFEQFELEPAIISITDVQAQLSTLVSKVLAARTEYEISAKKTQQEHLAQNMAPYQFLKTYLR